ncbi:MAG: hypothetical protein ACOCXT_06690 [Candidatus Dojkabacteria bacterium]
MKNNLRPIILTAIITLVLSISLEAQTTYDLSSEKSLQVFNQLPETLKPHFDEEFIAERLGNMEPAFDYRVGASAANNQIQLIIMIPDYTPEEPPKDAFGRPFKPGNRRLLPISTPQIYMLQLNRWYRNAWQSMPDDLKRAVNRYQLNVLVLFQKGDHSLMFGGKPGSQGLPTITQPIISTDPQYGEVQIWGDRSGYYTTVQRALNDGYYPLTAPVDKVTGEKKPSWLVYKFFDALPEE